MPQVSEMLLFFSVKKPIITATTPKKIEKNPCQDRKRSEVEEEERKRMKRERSGVLFCSISVYIMFKAKGHLCVDFSCCVLNVQPGHFPRNMKKSSKPNPRQFELLGIDLSQNPAQFEKNSRNVSNSKNKLEKQIRIKREGLLYPCFCTLQFLQEHFKTKKKNTTGHFCLSFYWANNTDKSTREIAEKVRGVPAGIHRRRNSLSC